MTELRKRILIKILVYIGYNLLLLFIAFLFNRFFQMLLFVLFFNLIRNCFKYQFHADILFPDNPIKAVRYCKLITVVVELIYMLLCSNLNISIYSNLIIIFVIAFISALLQFYCEHTLISVNILHNEYFLTHFGKEKELSDLAIQRLIDHYVKKMTIQQIAAKECVEEITIKQSIRRSKKKLGL